VINLTDESLAAYSEGSDPDRDFEQLLARAKADPNAQKTYEDTTRRIELLATGLKLRKAKGFTQSALASLMGTSQSAISDLESGRVEPQLRTLQRYARAIGIRFDFGFVDSSSAAGGDLGSSAMFVQEAALSPLLTTLVRQSEEQARTLQALASSILLPEPVIRPILSLLQAAGWTRSVSEGKDRVYYLVDEVAYVIGVSLERDRIVGVLMTLDGVVIGRTSVSSTDSSRSEVTETAAAVITDLFHRSDRRVLGVGVTIAGVVDAPTGRVDYAPELQSTKDRWSGVELQRDLEEAVGKNLGEPLKVAVENDANALAAWEYLRRGDDSVAVALLSGTGVGAGFVMEGKLLHGSHSAAGECGHTLLEREGPPCRAGHGHKGCLETMSSIEGILSNLGITGSSPTQRTEGLEAANQLIDRGDENVRTAFFEAGRSHGQFLATAVLLLDPARVATYVHPYLASKKYACGRAFRDGVQAALDEARSSRLPIVDQPRYEWHPLEDDSRAISAGAAGLWYFLKQPMRWAPSLLDPRNKSEKMPV
jgi:N-acetylglucosamine repressor